MRYCPYCAETIPESAKVCPHCKKSLDLEMLKEMYTSQDSSNINTQIKRRLWFQEHSHLIYPFITAVIGFIAGALLLYGFAQAQFASERSGYKNKITELEKTINEKDSAAGNAASDFQDQLNAKNEIITILTEQNDIFSRLIYFTSRLAKNSTITPAAQEDADFYTRNTKYLIRLFETEQKKLQETEYKIDKTYTLKSIPQLLE